MKAVFWISVIFFVLFIGACIESNYRWNKNYMSYCNIADRSSTIEAKSDYIDKFVSRLESLPYTGKYDAIFLKTPDLIGGGFSFYLYCKQT